jgi:hypothetical protein
LHVLHSLKIIYNYSHRSEQRRMSCLV